MKAKPNNREIPFKKKKKKKKCLSEYLTETVPSMDDKMVINTLVRLCACVYVCVCVCKVGEVSESNIILCHNKWTKRIGLVKMKF